MTAPSQRKGRIIRRKYDVIGEHRPSPRPLHIGEDVGGVIGRREYAARASRWQRLIPSRRTIILATLGTWVAVLAVLGGWVWQSPIFRVQEVSVGGSERISPEAVLSAAGLDHDSMFTLDAAAIEAAIRTLPLVQDAAVERDWPHTVRITLTERQPWAIWEQSGVRYSIDREGVVLGTTAMPPPGYPVIESSEQGSRIQGERVDFQAVEATAEIYEKLPAALGVEVTRVAFVAGKGVQVSTGDGQVAIFGDASAISYKLAVWSAVQAQAGERGIVYSTVDLRFGNRPVVQ